MEETKIEIKTEPINSSPNKRLKTQSPKGKSILPFPKNEPETESINCCGICLSETVIGCNNGVSRGFIDSCDHYFCFVCIMEWSKVESKCPLCKRRFSTIRRPSKPPLFRSERLVRVPVRDQVYCNAGNATIGPPNPYSDVKCSVCDSTAEENLLLLCDLCDSACHTFCVGLGATVPEGDWFCQECTLLRQENQESEPNVDSCPQVSYPTGRKILSVNENVPISDIVREPSSAAIRTSRTNSESTLTNNVGSQSSRRPEIIPAKSSARTLQVCHNVHDRIRIMRENWNGFQSGKFHFKNNQAVNSITTTRLSASSESGQNSVSAVSSSSQVDSGADKIHKAWKMLDKAKPAKKVYDRSAKRSLKKIHGLKASDASSKSLCANSLANKSNSSQYSGDTNRHNCSLEKDYRKQQYVASGKEKSGDHVNKAINHFEGSKTSKLPIRQDLKPCSSTGVSSYTFLERVNVEKLPAEKSLNGPRLMGANATPLVSSNSNVKDILDCKVKTQKKKSSDKSKQYYDAKSEIQSLVKLNLTLHTKDQKLDVEVFKEVAWIATHSILAACGLEQAKPGYCFSPGSKCLHPRELWQSERSSLMPNSCNECFCAFVKNMVTASLLQKKCIHENQT